MQAAVVARLQDGSTCQHRDGLLRALQLCERVINSNATSAEAYTVLKEAVAKAMLQPCQQVSANIKVQISAQPGCMGDWVMLPSLVAAAVLCLGLMPVSCMDVERPSAVQQSYVC